MRGFVNIDKPAGMTSSNVVVKVRGILRKLCGEKQKTGHLGTLDPLGTGVLPIAVGTATRTFDYMLDKTKVYIASFKFGTATDTLDCAGKVVETDGRIPSEDEIVKAIPQLTGEILQTPPQFSAKSVNGKRAYQLARDGIDVELRPKKVRIESIELLKSDEYSAICRDEGEYAFKIVCGGGTYIRSVARDMALSLDTFAYMSSIRRIKSGCFSIEESVTLEQFEASTEKYLIPLEYALRDFESFELPASDAERVLNGIKTRYEGLPQTGAFTVTLNDKIIGFAVNDNGILNVRTRL